MDLVQHRSRPPAWEHVMQHLTCLMCQHRITESWNASFPVPMPVSCLMLQTLSTVSWTLLVCVPLMMLG